MGSTVDENENPSEVASEEVSVEPSTPASDSSGLSETVPELLRGIWQGKDRIMMFSNENEFSVVLRVFYTWYNDRAAEPAKFKELKARDRNDTTSPKAEDISVKYKTVYENESKTAGAYELVVKYPNIKEPVYIPVAVVGGKIYLDFLIHDTDSEKNTSVNGSVDDSESEKSKDGLWRSAATADGITVSPPRFKKEVRSYYVNGKDVYHLRYWLSGMEYTTQKAGFSDGKSSFSVSKYLQIGDRLYQCTTGRSTKIRNVEKSNSLPANAVFDSELSICALSSPYLVKIDGENREELQKLVDSNNARKAPPPKPLFPVPEIEIHWRELTEVELYNPRTWNRRMVDVAAEHTTVEIKRVESK